jgi:hypothetical protein
MPRTQSSRTRRSLLKAADNYWIAAKRPLPILVFLLPLIIAYELGLVVLLRSEQGVLTNQAHEQLLRFFDMFGLSAATAAGALHLGGVAIIVVLLAWHLLNRDPWKFEGHTIAFMALESIVLTIPLLVLAQIIARTASQPIDVTAWTGAPASGQLAALSPWARITVSVGAGLYEELIFRMLLIALIHTLLVDMGKASHGLGVAIAVVVSAAAFTAYHPLAEPDGSVSWQRLIFFFLAGLYFGGVYAARGFGIVVAVHAFYDTVTSLFLLPD